MKRVICGIFIALAIALFSHPAASGCTVCHSKNPKMVKMHEQLGFKDCFSCHGPGKGKSPEERKKQMVTDSLCIRCHKR